MPDKSKNEPLSVVHPIVIEGLYRPDTRREFAAFYGVSLPSVNRWLKAKIISYIKVGRSVFIDRSVAVRELAAHNTVKSIGSCTGGRQ